MGIFDCTIEKVCIRKMRNQKEKNQKGYIFLAQKIGLHYRSINFDYVLFPMFVLEKCFVAVYWKMYVL